MRARILPAVELELLFARAAARADSAGRRREVAVAAGEPRQEVLEPRELDLRARLARPRVRGEDVENHAGPVQDADGLSPALARDCAPAPGESSSSKTTSARARLSRRPPDLLDRAPPDERRRIGGGTRLDESRDALRRRPFRASRSSSSRCSSTTARGAAREVDPTRTAPSPRAAQGHAAYSITDRDGPRASLPHEVSRDIRGRGEPSPRETHSSAPGSRSSIGPTGRRPPPAIRSSSWGATSGPRTARSPAGSRPPSRTAASRRSRKRLEGSSTRWGRTRRETLDARHWTCRASHASGSPGSATGSIRRRRCRPSCSTPSPGRAEEAGRIRAFFESEFRPEESDVAGLLSRVVARRSRRFDYRPVSGRSRRLPDAPARFFFPDPASGSACKRWNLYLRWMVRRDRLDFGLWRGIPTDRLVMPTDTHIHLVSRRLGLTRRRTADWTTARRSRIPLPIRPGGSGALRLRPLPDRDLRHLPIRAGAVPLRRVRDAREACPGGRRAGAGGSQLSAPGRTGSEADRALRSERRSLRVMNRCSDEPMVRFR